MLYVAEARVAEIAATERAIAGIAWFHEAHSRLWLFNTAQHTVRYLFCFFNEVAHLAGKEEGWRQEKASWQSHGPPKERRNIYRSANTSKALSGAHSDHAELVDGGEL